MSTNVTKEAYEAALNSEFYPVTDATAESRDERYGRNESPWTLVQYHVPLVNAVQECFTLLFRAPVTAPNEQGLYTLRHATLGDVELFLVPVKKNDEGLFFEAVFNRLLQ
jgi:hypothetical protein